MWTNKVNYSIELQITSLVSKFIVNNDSVTRHPHNCNLSLVVLVCKLEYLFHQKVKFRVVMAQSCGSWWRVGKDDAWYLSSLTSSKVLYSKIQSMKLNGQDGWVCQQWRGHKDCTLNCDCPVCSISCQWLICVKP